MSRRQTTFARRAPVVSPADYSLIHWQDFSVLSSLFQLSGGTTACTADGDPIGYAGDRTGSGTRHFIQATAGARPTLRLSGNGLWCAEFVAASSQRLVVTNNMGLNGTAQPFTTCVVCARTGTGATQVVWGLAAAAASAGHLMRLPSGNTYQSVRTNDAGASAALSTSGLGGTFQIQNRGWYILTHTWDGVSGVLRVNGVTYASGAQTADTLTVAKCSLGSREVSTPTGFFDGYIGEAFCITGSQTAETCLKLERYLGRKWGVAV
jgi:hypothetical protein